MLFYLKLLLKSIKQKITRKHFIGIIISLIFSLYFVYMIVEPYLYAYFYHPGAKCYINHMRDSEIIRLTDILENIKKPTPGKSIFFHETSCTKDGIVQLNARQACAIESAAKMNPSWDVFVLFASPVGFTNASQQPIIESLLAYPNIHFRNVNLWSYARGTPVEDWINDGKIFFSKYMNSHVSDFLRYLSLYKFGGTYLDLDVIVKQNFDKLLPNYAGAESDRFVAAGVLNFEHNGMGHKISEMCIREFKVSFDGSDWGNNGPGVITRVLNRICLTKNPLYMDRNRCKGFQVYPVKSFYAVRWKNWKYFFEEKRLAEVNKLTNNSVVVHVWNKFSIKKRIKVGSKVAYGLLADNFCPKVYRSCGEYF